MAVDKNGKKLPSGIRQRNNGRYEGRVKHEYQSYSVYGTTVTEVKKKMTDLRNKLEHGDLIASAKITMDDWFQSWIEQYKENQVKIGTVISYQNYYKSYIKGKMGKKKLVDIRGEHVQKLYNDLKKEDMALSSIKVISAILNGCLKQALKNGLIEQNPVPLATLPKGALKKRHRVFTKDEQEIFFQYARYSYLYNLFALVIRTGLRSGEIRGLKLSDVDKSAGLLHIQRTLKYEPGRGFFEDTPKTASSKRDIPLTRDMILFIEQE